MTDRSTRPPASSFHGRQDELRAIARAFDEVRLVTIAGPGGMGKTRLALHHLAESETDFASGGGVVFVDLTRATTVEDLDAAVARASGVGSKDLGAELDRLGPTLVVLDNMEQLVDVARERVDGWLRDAPALRLLVTSRAPLESAAERVVTLEPLALDDAMALFRSRTGRDGNDDDVRAIVEAIDCMPLALELAASRTRMLSLAELRTRLENPLAVLETRQPDRRHGSVRRAVLDSVALLDDDAQRAFALASLLQDGFTTADAEAVLGPFVADVAAALEALGRVSLLRSETSSAVARHGSFTTVREVARVLAAKEPRVEDARRHHALHFAKRAAADRPVSHRDVDNLLVAHAFCIAEPAVEEALTLALALAAPLTARGQAARLHVLLGETIACGVEGEALARLLLERARVARELGETRAASEDLERALELVEGKTPLGAAVVLALGEIDDVHGATDRARDRYAEALTHLTDGDALAVKVRLALAHAHRREGELDQGREVAAEAARGARGLGDTSALATALYELGAMAMFAEERDEAAACFDEGLEVAERAGLRVMEGALTNARGVLHQDVGELDDAIAAHARAARTFSDCGSRHREGSALYYLATAYVERGSPREALPILDRARERLEPIEAPRYDALVSSCMAVALSQTRRHAEAAREIERAARAQEMVTQEPALEAAIRLLRAAVDAARTGTAPSIPEAHALAKRHGNDDSRFALRVLEQFGAPAPKPAEAWRVWAGGAAFCPPGGERVALPARSPLRLVLERLVRTRLRAPGERVTVHELIEAGWPDEKITSASALNRAYVALATLRKKGLRPVLEKVAGGYALSTATTFIIVD